jgi:ubiquitin-like-conjugating enzyme ATG3
MFASLHSVFHTARQAIMPVLKESAFFKEGVLTPDEFIIAGDQLISSQRTWKWRSGEVKKTFLPPDKQFLILTIASCRQRVSGFQEGGNIQEVEEEGDWISSGEDRSKIDEYADIDGDDVDPAVAQMMAADNSTVMGAGIEVRRYEVSIVYDNYYRTPRVYLKGYGSSGCTLGPIEMMEDIVQDYAGKTATMETHPHLPSDGAYISIHPCRHAETMKRILEGVAGDNMKAIPTVESYLFFFLKFIASMIPTIEYDYTYSV